MVAGICSITLIVHDANSLKEKRHVLKSLIERLKSRFNISIAETGLNDKWQSAEIGIACISNDKVQIDKVISSILNFIENDPRVEITDSSVEIY
ncbi:hypothetical protein OXPF_11780 [Oxobacter pfennigii]|uniref:YlxP-like protein n=1 Tax=Oxobacter pfennigii TaxID=36849 RepID=A0A0P8YZJ1_9CLOT|nr:DUF503 domain-containing protein [Oxobacter pfennigii]KPU45285.1 hypothetical protein OXPF_11780 [Oxobacter pfennigii]